MIRFLFRFVGLFVLAGAFVAFIYDGTQTLAGNKVIWTPLRSSWNAIHSTSLPILQSTIEHRAPWLWEPVSVYVLGAPTSLVLAILGALLILIGRKKKRLIGYARD